MKDSPTPQKISPRTMNKLIARKRQMEDDGIPASEYSYTHQIDVAVDKAELLNEVYIQYQRLWNHLAHYIRTFESEMPTANSPTEMWDAYGKMGDIMTKAKAIK